MPRATETPLPALGFCLDATCPGNTQAPADAIKTLTEFTFGDAGCTDGMAAFVERSNEKIRFADEADAICEICDGPRGISEQTRPVYPKASNAKESQNSSAEVNIMKMMMDQQAEMARLRAELEAKTAEPVRRGPGRPPKVVEE